MARKRKHFINFLLLLRPRQWLKNLFIFAPILFSGRLLIVPDFFSVLTAFLIFCFLSSACYAFNDALDYRRDRRHPAKRFRPVASGEVSRRQAFFISALLFSFVLISAGRAGGGLLIIAGSFAALNLAYNFWLKRIPLADVSAIAFGYLLRVFAGGVVINVEVSRWLTISVFTLALFLGAGKRRGDRSSVKYPASLLEGLILLSLVLANVSYLLYAFSRKHQGVLISVIFVLYGTLRYLYLLKKHPVYPDPTDLILKDRQLPLVIVLWFLYMVGMIYAV